MGIGLNSGPFMSGNVGSRAPPRVHGDRRHDQHRLAHPGHDEGHAVPRSSSPTRRGRRSSRTLDDLVYIDEFAVRGRAQPIKIWSIEAASDAAFEELKAAGYGAAGQVAAAGADVDRLVPAEVADLDDAALHDGERSVALILDEPLRPAHRGRAVAALGREPTLAVAPEPADRPAALRVRVVRAQPARRRRPGSSRPGARGS